MTRPGYLEGVVFALIAALAGALLFPALILILAPVIALKLLMIVASAGYLVYLLKRSDQKLGRITAAACWLIITLASWLLAPSLLSLAAIHLLMIWLVRSLYFYSSLLSALADLGLSALALLVACWAWVSSGNLFLLFWSYFLVQGLFVAIPRVFSIAAGPAKQQQRMASAGAFETAHSAAEQALRKLFTSV